MKIFEKWLESTSLPNTAKAQLPNALSKDTKRRLLERQNAEEIIVSAIESINKGAVETVETLINRQLE